MSAIDIINCLIATLGFIISIINLIYIVYTDKKKIKLLLNEYTVIKIKNESYYMFNLFCNNESKHPIAVSSIKIFSRNKEYIIQTTPRRLMSCEEKKGDEIYSRKELYSSIFPYNLGSFSSGLMLCLLKTEDKLSEEIALEIYTNRGKIKQKVVLKSKEICFEKFDKDLADFCRAQRKE